MIPQAYTARDIGEAYKWIQTLPQPVRDEMKTMEQMVLYYLKAKAMGQLNNFQTQEYQIATQKAAEKKSQEFQKTLVNLKTEMDQFDYVQNPPPELAIVPNPTPTPQQTQNTSQNNSQNQQANILSSIKMDPKSRQILNEIRESLNLSTDLEVVRMSLVLAQKALKQILDV